MLPATRLFSPSKVNLGLRIVGRNERGFHLLESLFWPLDFGDTVEIKETSAHSSRVFMKPGQRVAFPQTFPTESSNLVFRLMEEIRRSKGRTFETTIEKNIPMGGGLGGGSSNVGILLSHLIQEGLLSKNEAAPLALQLGADVPYFINPVPSWVTGVGEVTEPVTPPDNLNLYFILIVFPFPTLTAEIFKRYAESGLPFSHSSAKPKDLVSYLRNTGNDLEEIVARSEPLIGKTLQELRATGPLYSGLSGTGSTCVAVYPSEEERKISTQVLEPFCRTTLCKNIAAKTYQRTV